MKKRNLMCLWALVWLVALPWSATAMMIQVPLEQRADDAREIIEGTVTSVQSEWTADRANIVTKVTVTINENWKGDLGPGNSVTVQVAGGEVEGLRCVVEHMPTFAEGENVVLFLVEHPDQNYRIEHREQGKYTVASNLAVGYDHQPISYTAFKSRVTGHVGEEVQR